MFSLAVIFFQGTLHTHEQKWSISFYNMNEYCDLDNNIRVRRDRVSLSGIANFVNLKKYSVARNLSYDVWRLIKLKYIDHICHWKSWLIMSFSNLYV